MKKIFVLLILLTIVAGCQTSPEPSPTLQSIPQGFVLNFGVAEMFTPQVGDIWRVTAGEFVFEVEFTSQGLLTPAGCGWMVIGPREELRCSSFSMLSLNAGTVYLAGSYGGQLIRR